MKDGEIMKQALQKRNSFSEEALKIWIDMWQNAADARIEFGSLSSIYGDEVKSGDGDSLAHLAWETGSGIKSSQATEAIEEYVEALKNITQHWVSNICHREFAKPDDDIYPVGWVITKPEDNIWECRSTFSDGSTSTTTFTDSRDVAVWSWAVVKYREEKKEKEGEKTTH